MVDAGPLGAAQPWSNGRLGIYGGSYGGYLVLTSLVDEPALWSAGVDLYGDSRSPRATATATGPAGSTSPG
jgi:dipeptidyl aminopeptidase/acylaminoacyl peptidase